MCWVLTEIRFLTKGWPTIAPVIACLGVGGGGLTKQQPPGLNGQENAYAR